MKRVAIDIFTYNNFRKYIKDYYDANNAVQPAFSYQFLADKGGFDNRILVYRIIENKLKKIATEYCIKLSKAFNHTPQEAEYFSCLFDLDQIRNEEKRCAIRKRMNEIIDSRNIKVRMVKKDEDHETYYAELYHSVIRALIGFIHPSKHESKQLRGLLLLPVTEEQVCESISLLERIGFIREDTSGAYEICTEENIRTSREYSQKYKDILNLKYMEVARTLIERHIPTTPKLFKTKTIGISDHTYREICRLTDEMINKIDILVQNEQEADRVYMYQFTFIPLTKSHSASESER